MRFLDGSGVSREVHAPFCERLGVRFLRPTHHETFNTLKNQDYNLGHNYGLGKKNLSGVFTILMMLAFLIDQAQQLSCWLFQEALAKEESKRSLWEAIRAFFRNYQVDSMETILRAIAHGIDGPALKEVCRT